MARPSSIAYDNLKNRVLVLDGFGPLGAIFSVDLATGNRTILSSATIGSGADWKSIRDIAFDEANNRALVVMTQSGVVAVNLVTGNRTILSSNTIGTGVNFDSPDKITLDEANNRALVTDFGLNVIFSVDLTTGKRTVLSGMTIGAGPIFQPGNITFDGVNNRALVNDRSGLFVLDPNNGEEVLFTSGGGYRIFVELLKESTSLCLVPTLLCGNAYLS